MHVDCYHKMYQVEKNHWWFRGKMEIAKMLLRQFGISAGKKILDVGCGTGSLAKSLIDERHVVTGVDSETLALDYCRKRGLTDLVTANAAALPFSDESFDAVVALDLLEHLDDDAAAIKEWGRVLKLGGIMLIFVPALPLLWGPQDVRLGHKRRYTSKTLRQTFGANFFLEKVSYFNSFLFVPILCLRFLFRHFPSLLAERDELDFNNTALNGLFLKIFSFEKKYLTKFNFPIGVSLLAVMRKKTTAAQVEAAHYKSSMYDHKARWLSYWYQIRAVLENKPRTVLEVGPGNGLVTAYLKNHGLNVSTLDIDQTLKPDIVGSVTSIPLGDNSVDCVLAAEILEHLPFADVSGALAEIKRVTKNRAVISIPDSRRTLLSWGLKLPFLPRFDLLLKIQSNRKHVFDGQHYWEVGKRGYSLKKIKYLFEQAGFKIVKNFVPFDCPTKHFFVLEKNT